MIQPDTVHDSARKLVESDKALARVWNNVAYEVGNLHISRALIDTMKATGRTMLHAHHAAGFVHDYTATEAYLQYSLSDHGDSLIWVARAIVADGGEALSPEAYVPSNVT